MGQIVDKQREGGRSPLLQLFRGYMRNFPSMVSLNNLTNHSQFSAKNAKASTRISSAIDPGAFLDKTKRGEANE